MAIKPIYHRVIGIANERETSAHAEHTKKGGKPHLKVWPPTTYL